MLLVWHEMLILHCWFLRDFTYLFQFKLEVWTWWHGSVFSFLLVINIPDTEQRSCTRTYIQIVLFLWSRRMLKLNDPFTYELSANKFSHRSGSVSLPSVRDRCPLQQAAVNDVLCVCEQWLVVKWKITTGSELLRFLSVLSNYNVNINIHFVKRHIEVRITAIMFQFRRQRGLFCRRFSLLWWYSYQWFVLLIKCIWLT